MAMSRPSVSRPQQFAGSHLARVFDWKTRTWRTARGGTIEPRQRIDFDYEQDTGGARCPFHAHILEFIQSAWANSIHFVKMNGGLDGVIGQGTQVPDGPLWCKTYGNLDETIGFDFSDVIKLRGGDYFFAPSVAFLQGLG
ncbi:hypothetical protein JRI60_43780 [Archangium violaceum]|uniref:hypothetical protein n=1 Tax=Archangium violaceum TaxID=83451 RepID=UPI001950B7FC|nr:hypothetical protein [Archangium violaceum]QRN95896.1 hypothetical protein JRI60_43780 [Archangium violaceum]